VTFHNNAKKKSQNNFKTVANTFQKAALSSDSSNFVLSQNFTFYDLLLEDKIEGKKIKRNFILCVIAFLSK